MDKKVIKLNTIAHFKGNYIDDNKDPTKERRHLSIDKEEESNYLFFIKLTSQKRKELNQVRLKLKMEPDSVEYGGFNLIHCSNSSPYSNYQVDDHLGICIGYIEKGGNTAPPSQNVFSDRSIVTKMVKAPAGYNGTTIDDLVFGRG
ncbi:401_t:CDS:2 [Funneliformis geosporum]|nr:401_t:CDS:2 [Funneliformis geosporum]